MSRKAAARRSYTAGHFALDIDGKLMGGLSHGTESVVEYKDGEDGTMHTRPGRITLQRDYSNTPEWHTWR